MGREPEKYIHSVKDTGREHTMYSTAGIYYTDKQRRDPLDSDLKKALRW